VKTMQDHINEKDKFGQKYLYGQSERGQSTKIFRRPEDHESL
jgi:hypothetical protein